MHSSLAIKIQFLAFSYTKYTGFFFLIFTSILYMFLANSTGCN